MALASLLIGLVHALAGAAWFGAMIYSLLVLQPKAAAFFTKPSDFEAFAAHVAHGARWKVLAAFALVAVTGLALIALRWRTPASPLWVAAMIAKAALLLTALAVFGYASWRLWPARVFAADEEVPGFQRAFRRVGIAMIALIGAAFTLGVLARAL